MFYALISTRCYSGHITSTIFIVEAFWYSCMVHNNTDNGTEMCMFTWFCLSQCFGRMIKYCYRNNCLKLSSLWTGRNCYCCPWGQVLQMWSHTLPTGLKPGDIKQEILITASGQNCSWCANTLVYCRTGQNIFLYPMKRGSDVLLSLFCNFYVDLCTQWSLCQLGLVPEMYQDQDMYSLSLLLPKARNFEQSLHFNLTWKSGDYSTEL